MSGARFIPNENPDEPEAMRAPEPWKPEPWQMSERKREIALREIEAAKATLRAAKPPTSEHDLKKETA